LDLYGDYLFLIAIFETTSRTWTDIFQLNEKPVIDYMWFENHRALVSPSCAFTIYLETHIRSLYFTSLAPLLPGLFFFFSKQPSTRKSTVNMKPVVSKQEDTLEIVALTPDRTTADFEQKKNNTIMTTETKTVPKTVTPPEASNKDESVLDSNEKQVRFGKDEVGQTPEHKEGHHPTRRFRYPSSSGKSQSAPGGAVLEFKTYRSPSRKRDEEVPSLCSTSSEAPAEKSSKSSLPTSSISVDPTQATTSPLASQEGEKKEKHTQEKEKYTTDEVSTRDIFEFGFYCF